MLRYVITNLFFLLFSFQLSSQSLSDITFGTDSTFEVVTWNIEWFPKNGSLTVDSVGKIIRSLDVDLLGLQEIDDTTLCRQMIDSLPGYELFMDNVWFGGLAYVYKTSSISIQSIYKIYDTSPFWNAFPRSPLVIEFTFMGEELVVINNHFKCCGDGLLDLGNSADEEARRYEASSLLKQYVDANFPSSKVIIIGDLNDILTDGASNNVFQMFLNDSINYMFSDEAVAIGSSSDWSFPGWPSHLDHILITSELFSEFSSAGSDIQTIKVDDFLPGGLTYYDANISDHRPVGLKINIIPTLVEENKLSFPPILISPNPSDGLFTIDLGKRHRSIGIKIIGLDGKIIQSGIYVESLLIVLKLEEPAGVYLLIIESGSNKTVKRLVIK